MKDGGGSGGLAPRGFELTMSSVPVVMAFSAVPLLPADKLPVIAAAWATNTCKYDPRHWLGVLFETVRSKASPVFPIFAKCVAMCVYKPLAGKYCYYHTRYVIKHTIYIISY